MSLDQPTRRSLARSPSPQLLVHAGHHRRGRSGAARSARPRHRGCAISHTLMERLSRWRTDASTGLIRSALAASRETTSSPATPGFVYDARGFCVHVPTQSEIPVGARVRAYRSMKMAFSCGPGWVSPRWPAFATAGHALAQRPRLGDTRRCWETEADLLLLLHENFADITHVAVVDPFIAPPVLRSSPPPLGVEVTETTVSFSRTYEPADSCLAGGASRIAGRRRTRPA